MHPFSFLRLFAAKIPWPEETFDRSFMTKEAAMSLFASTLVGF
jgi:hypothetical protein